MVGADGDAAEERAAMNRTLTLLVSASALLGGCVGVPPAVNPTVEVWNVEPAANTDIADMIIEQVVDQVFSLVSSALDDSSAEPTRNHSICLFWCFHERGTRSYQPAPQPVAGPVVYQYSSYSEPPRPAIKPTPRPAQIAAPKPVAPKEHAPRQTTHTPAARPSTPKPSKPAASSTSSKKTVKK
jgi:cell division septation protein DedD